MITFMLLNMQAFLVQIYEARGKLYWYKLTRPEASFPGTYLGDEE